MSVKNFKIFEVMKPYSPDEKEVAVFDGKLFTEKDARQQLRDLNDKYSPSRLFRLRNMSK